MSNQELENLDTSHEINGDVILFINNDTELVAHRREEGLIPIKVENDAYLRLYEHTRAQYFNWRADLLPWNLANRKFIELDLDNFDDLDSEPISIELYSEQALGSIQKFSEAGFEITTIEPPGITPTSITVRNNAVAGHAFLVDIYLEREADHKVEGGFKVRDEKGNFLSEFSTRFGGQKSKTETIELSYDTTGDKYIYINGKEFQINVISGVALTNITDDFGIDMPELLLKAGMYRLGKSKERSTAVNKLPRMSRSNISDQYIDYLEELGSIIQDNKAEVTNVVNEQSNEKYSKNYNTLDKDQKLDIVFEVGQHFDERVELNKEANFRDIINRIGT